MTNAQTGQQRRGPRRVALGLGGLLVLAAIVFGIAWLQHGSDPAVEKLRERLAAREHAPPAAPDPTPAPAPDQPPAPAPPRAEIATDPTWHVEKDEAWWEQWQALAETPTAERSEADRQALAAMLEERSAWLAEAEATLAQPGLWEAHPASTALWDAEEWTQALMARLPLDKLLMDYTRLLLEQAALQAHQGDHSAALDSLRTIWHAWRQAEPLMAGDQVMRGSFMTITLAQLANLDLGPRVLEPETVRQLVAVLGATDMQQALSNALANDVQFALRTFQETRRGSAAVPGAPLWTRLGGKVYTTFFIRADEAAYARLMARLLPALEAPYFAAMDEVQAVQQDLEELSFARPFTKMTVDSNISLLENTARHQTKVDLARLGLLIELHHAEHGAYPENLSVLAPELGGSVPVDPFTGQPYRYRETPGGFQLYSLGPNMQDNGGHHDRRAGDIVWRGR